jgi:hypothetical protein
MDYMGKLNDLKLKLDYIYSDIITTYGSAKTDPLQKFRIPDTRKHQP